MACALGNYACRNLRKVMFVQAADLYEDIILSIADGSIAKVKQKYCKVDLLIIDDFGIGELLPQICPVLLDIIDKQSSVGGLLITSQYPVAAWHGLFPEAIIADAVLDRIIHRAYPLALAGESMRKKLAHTIN
ncbi:ATP-binding protein [Moraxella nonliquefaciens]|uniref:ATP-binding protein n=1 Tax=Moraxella nonliquefaciens TaxID=478 RepID=A0A7T3F0K5_MORNO|nr:ATP-binding protein [Moraxella nonliquefaciens]QQC30743.1 ATP-binding protein [Moraxella nonliquefaciens]